MTGQYIVTTITEHFDIEGADNIVRAEKFGETLILNKEQNPIGTRGIVIDCLSQIDLKLAHYLNLYRHSDLNQDKDKVGYFGDNARVRAIRLRGVKCSAIFLSFEQLGKHPDLAWSDLNVLKDGVQGNEIAGVPISQQYFVKKKQSGNSNKQAKARENLVPTFREHIDTDQLARNLHKFKKGDQIVITEKLHGTSLRCAKLPVISWKSKLLKKIGINSADYKFVVGSRRVTKSIDNKKANGKEHFYSQDLWTTAATLTFGGKLNKGETIYAEIVGYQPDSDQTIMPSCENKKLKSFLEKDKFNSFRERYGDATNFTYGCESGQYKVFVYRITMTNLSGDTVDYSWEAVKQRCEQMDVQHVPELHTLQLSLEDDRDNQQWLASTALALSEDPSEAFPQNIREGVCVRREGILPLILKEKAFSFKVLEGIIKEKEDTIEDE